MSNPQIVHNELQTFQRVKVYRNIRKKIFSVLDKKTGRLVAHKHSLVLTNVEFKISKAGQRRARIEKQKNVHAYVIGDFLGALYSDESNFLDFVLVNYNPYLMDTFIIVDGNTPIYKAEKCYLINGKCFVDKNFNN